MCLFLNDERYMVRLTLIDMNPVKLKVGLSTSKKNLCDLLDSKPFKNDEKCSLCHLESSLPSQVAIHILPNISQSKGNQTMKFGQLIEYNKGNIFLQKLSRK